jgi:hypothetical protein
MGITDLRANPGRKAGGYSHRNPPASRPGFA